jgi:hypothetical protein
MNKKIAGIILGVVVIASGSFYVGTQYGVNTTQANQTDQTGSGGKGGGRRNGGGGFVSGEVLSKDAQGITLKMRDGGSSIVFIASSTTILKSTAGTVDDITIGAQVMVNGSKNQDGSTSAQSIQIRPESSKTPRVTNTQN